jgi:hypothetical protein
MRGRKRRVILIARYFFYHPEDEPFGDSVPTSLNSKLYPALQQENPENRTFSHKTIQSGIALARKIRELDPSSADLVAIGFRPLPSLGAGD